MAVSASMAATVNLPLRNYQEAALLKARKGNLIMVGATGVGKTLVAINLLKEADHSEGRLSFFLVTTRHLAEQQHERIKESTALSAELLVGMELDLWSKQQWQEVFSRNQVIVCTAQVLLNLLDKGLEYITMERISLLILDECHQAVKAHPYTKIMAYYDGVRYSRLPKVFGMTATPRKGCFDKLHSVLHVCPEEETRPYASCAPLTLLDYRPEAVDVSDFEDVVTELQGHIKGFDNVKERDVGGLRSTAVNYGGWLALRHLQLLLDHVRASKMRHASEERSQNDCQHELVTCLDYVLQQSAQSHSRRQVDRVRQLLAALRQRKKAGSEDFRALVFVQRRVVCRVLCDYLNLQEPFQGRCGFAVGEAGSSGVACHGVSQQESVKGFREGGLEILVATDVMAEGIDIPACNLVVCVDDIPNETRYAQMRGRARKSDGDFIVLVGDEKTREKVRSLEFQARLLQENPSMTLNQSGDILNSEQYPQYVYRVRGTGATINLANAISMLYHFCQLHPECQSYALEPLLDYDEVVDPISPLAPPHWTCRLVVPPVLDMTPHEFRSPPFPSKTMAKAVVFFEAVKQLREVGLLDTDLNPVSTSQILETYHCYDGSLPTAADVEAARVEIQSGAADMGLAPVLTSDAPANEQVTGGGTGSFLLYVFRGCTLLALLTRSRLPEGWGWADDFEEVGGGAVDLSEKQLDSISLFHTLLAHRVIHGKKAHHDASDVFVRDEAALRALMAASCDKGYLLTVLTDSRRHIDWGFVSWHLNHIGHPLISSAWPLPTGQPSDWIVQQQHVHSTGGLYAVVEVTKTTLAEERAKPRRGAKRCHDAADGQSALQKGGDDDSEEEEMEEEDKAGMLREPSLVLAHHKEEVWDSLNQNQPLLLVEKTRDTSHEFRVAVGSRDTGKIGMRCLLAPELCKLISFPRCLYCGVQAVLPALWQLESKCKVHQLLQRAHIPGLTASGLERAISKPEYERAEFLGDAYLKVAMSHYVMDVEPFLRTEGLLSDFRSNLVCNARLKDAAMTQQLHKCIILKGKARDRGFMDWAPSLMAPTQGPTKVSAKVVADVAEACIGACLCDGGPAAADAFITWLGLPVVCDPNRCVQSAVRDPEEAWPLARRDCKCWSVEALQARKVRGAPYPVDIAAPADDLFKRLSKLEDLLGHTFANKWFAVEALTHPSYRNKRRRTAEGTKSLIHDYQRMEFLGDAVLDYVTATSLYHDTSAEAADVKGIHSIKQPMVCNESLAQCAVTWFEAHKQLDCENVELGCQVAAYVREVRSMLTERRARLNGRPAPKALADVMESLIGAVFIDSGGNHSLIHRLFVTRLRKFVSEDRHMRNSQGREELGDQNVMQAAPGFTSADLRRLGQQLPLTVAFCLEAFPTSIMPLV